MLSVKVEATSANLCVGFDVLGLALNLTNTFTFDVRKSFSFKGFPQEFSSTNTNMVYDAYKYVFDKSGEDIIPVEIGFEGDIPVSRGLGSSSSLIVAGLFAANYFLKNKYTKHELFDFATEIEGHPDNVAPAIYGGLVASYKAKGKYYPNLFSVADNLKFTVIIPPVKVSTQEARKVLPESYSRAECVHNMSRIAVLPRAFETGNLEMIMDLFDDKIHEPYRSKLIPGYDEIKRILANKKVAFAISGSGSTMLVVSYDTKFKEDLEQLGYEMKTLEIGKGVELEVIE